MEISDHRVHPKQCNLINFHFCNSAIFASNMAVFILCFSAMSTSRLPMARISLATYSPYVENSSRRYALAVAAGAGAGDGGSGELGGLGGDSVVVLTMALTRGRRSVPPVTPEATVVVSTFPLPPAAVLPFWSADVESIVVLWVELGSK